MRINKVNSLRRLVFMVLLSTITSSFLCSSSDSLLTNLSAQRTDNGGIIFVGQIKLPMGTKVMIDLRQNNRLLGQDTVFLKAEGIFKSIVFRNGNKPHSAGTYQVKMYSYFSAIWQSPEIIKQVGSNGALLLSTLLVPDDPEFPSGARHLEVTQNVVFPGVAYLSNSASSSFSEQDAIKVVQNAYLSTPDGGRSADPVKGVIAFIEKGGGFKPLSWTAKQSSPGVWIVTLDCIDARQNKKAQWEYNSTTKIVKYLDPLAKILSWTPAY